MTHRLTTNCAKNYCNRTIIVKDIVENVVTCFLGTRCIKQVQLFLCWTFADFCRDRYRRSTWKWRTLEWSTYRRRRSL